MQSGFDVIVDMRWEAEDLSVPVIGTRPQFFIWAPIVDGPTLPNELILKSAVDAVRALWIGGLKVLVHCQQGSNRSRLVVGCVLGSGQSAIDLIRSKRPGALYNQVFAQKVIEWK